MKRMHSHDSGFTLVEIMIVVAIIGLLATIAIPNYIHARMKSQQTVCNENLLAINNAKQVWAMENRAPRFAAPVLGNIQPYIGRGTLGTAPVCPADPAKSFGTSYQINGLDNDAACLIMPAPEGGEFAHHLD